MSELRVFWPEDFQLPAPARAQQAVAVRSVRAAVVRPDVVQRARVVRENRICRVCGNSGVLPLVGDDAEVSRNGRPIPGTGTLLGFHCCGCGCEWSV